jgi:hypothetical protein
MGKKNTLLVVLAVIVLIALGGVFGYFYLIDKDEVSPGLSSERKFVPPPDIVKEVTHVEEKFTIGTKKVSRGDFKKVEKGNIYYGEYLLSLTPEQVALVCTSQDLATAEVVDYKLVTDVKALTPDTVVDNIRKGEPIVVFAEDIEAVLTAHTIAINSASCSE